MKWLGSGKKSGRIEQGVDPPRSLRVVTAWLIVGATGLLAAYDVVVAANRAPGDTISEVLRDWGRSHPILAVAFGVLIGHWFWTPEARGD